MSAYDDDLDRADENSLPEIRRHLNRRLNALERKIDKLNGALWLLVAVAIGQFIWLWRHYGL